ncbi:tripartite tricarboxylate transporter substrate binding protein [Camelimonas abortus]|uniref:Tripartite tricarboxylate transporter substrate binding protein n=1 Tax=Camelimonas abortus TaxID=1017184 RepID=A0ABV7LES7_9HYPH
MPASFAFIPSRVVTASCWRAGLATARAAAARATRATRAALAGVALAAAALGPAAGPAAADDWPSREITLINNFPPGSATELTARALARSIEKTLNATIVIKAVPGGAGQLGPAELARSKPDGYTMGLVGSSTYLTAPHMMDVPFRAWEAFDLIAQAAELRYGIGVRKDSPVRSVQDIIELSKQKRLTYSSTSPNNVLPLFQMAKLNGANLRWIVFAGGAESVLQAVGGHVDMTLQSATEMKPQIEAGNLRLIASTSAHRWPEYPDVPTLRELGFNYISIGPMGYAFPKGVDPKIRDRMEEAFRVALQDPEVLDTLRKLGVQPEFRTGADFYKYMKDMEPLFIQILTESGMKTR